jgi:cell division protease FtsH
MVCEWGMSERMGPLTFGKKEEQVFLGRDFAHQQDYSEETARAIDAEVRRIVTEGYQTAHKVLSAHVDQLKNIAEALLEHETIDGEDIDKVLAGGKIERLSPPPPRAVVAEANKEKRPSIFARPPVLKDEPEKA